MLAYSVVPLPTPAVSAAECDKKFGYRRGGETDGGVADAVRQHQTENPTAKHHQEVLKSLKEKPAAKHAKAARALSTEALLHDKKR
jgi:hypothetical protein